MAINYGSANTIVKMPISEAYTNHVLTTNESDDIGLQLKEQENELELAKTALRNEVSERKSIERLLLRSECERKLLSAQLLSAREMERKRIASELHDGLGQSLSAIKFYLESIRSIWSRPQLRQQHLQHGAEMVDRIVPKIQDAIDEVRRISMGLHPSTIDDLGIVPTIAWFCREFRSIYTHIRLDTYIDDDIDEDKILSAVKTAIYRVLQESMNNVAKHSNAGNATVFLCKKDSVVELMIQDNGVGIDFASLSFLKKSEAGMGISGMQERTEFSGGTFFIRSDSEAGTTVSASWPYR